MDTPVYFCRPYLSCEAKLTAYKLAWQISHNLTCKMSESHTICHVKRVYLRDQLYDSLSEIKHA